MSTLADELEQEISKALYGKTTQELDLPEASKFVDISEKLLSKLVPFIEDKTKGKYSFDFMYYYIDPTGYYFDTGRRTPITVTANSKDEAMEKVWEIIPNKSGSNVLRASLRKVTEL